MATEQSDTQAIGEDLKQQICQLVDSLVQKDPERYESDFVLLLARVQDLVERKRKMEGSKTDTRDLVTELMFSRLRRGMHLFLQSEDELEAKRAAEWVMGALFSISTLTEFAQAFDQALLKSSHTNNDFNFASRTDFLSLEEVLQMLASGKHTGCLSLEKADNRLDIYLSSGRVAFLDGHHMIRRVIPAADSLRQREIPTAAVNEAEARRATEGRPVLLALHDAGQFKDSELREVLRLFGREVLFDFMMERDPFVFFFRRLEELPEFVQEHEMKLGVTSLLLEGSKRLDDWAQMIKLFPDPAAPIEPRSDMFARMADTALDVLEIKLLSQINGEISPRGLVPVLGLPLSDVYQRLVRLAREGIIASPAGETAVSNVRMSVEESMQEAFAALDANDDKVARKNVLDQVLGGESDDEIELDEDAARELADKRRKQNGDQRKNVLDRLFAGEDEHEGDERRLDQGFLKMIGKPRDESEDEA